MWKPRKLHRLFLSLAATVALVAGPTAQQAQAQGYQWYWDDFISTCVDPCSVYIEDWCWCRKLPPIIIE